MASYSILFEKRAEKELRKLPREALGQVAAAIDKLAVNPRPPQSKRLIGHIAGYRLRVGPYRVLYTVKQEIVTVLIIKIAHRREVYRR